MSTIYMIESHDQVLDLWRSHNMVSLEILHLDFHCDMRGLLIDRNAQLAYRILDLKQTVDPGNFLTYAVMENRLSSVRWVHGKLGGRRDDVGTVKYETDFTALPYHLILRFLNRKGISLNFQEISDSDWEGIKDGEMLDIDWDYFACTAYPQDSIPRRVSEFLTREFQSIPNQTYICYSQDFSHPSRGQWNGFGEELAERFGANIIYLPPKSEAFPSTLFYKRYFTPSTFRFMRSIYYGISLWLRRRGIY